MDNYVDVMSLMEQPFYKQVEYEVTDNWWHSSRYYNLPLKDFMDAIKQSIRKGYTICVVGDISEPGYRPEYDVAMIPDFDIPSGYINDYGRQFRFSNDSTTDDHAVHLVGYLEGDDGKDWYLIKDSGTKAQNGNNKGYFFYHEDFVKLKVMNILVNKAVLEEVVGEKFKDEHTP